MHSVKYEKNEIQTLYSDIHMKVFCILQYVFNLYRLHKFTLI
jgi:hypothetical protein